MGEDASQGEAGDTESEWAMFRVPTRLSGRGWMDGCMFEITLPKQLSISFSEVAYTQSFWKHVNIVSCHVLADPIYVHINAAAARRLHWIFC